MGFKGLQECRILQVQTVLTVLMHLASFRAPEHMDSCVRSVATWHLLNAHCPHAINPVV